MGDFTLLKKKEMEQETELLLKKELRILFWET